MKDVFQYIDFYGPQLTLTFNKSDKYKTILGGLLTLLTIFIIIIYTIIFSKSLFSKSNFKIITSNTISPESSFDFSKFPLVVGFTNSEGILLKDERLFNIHFFDYNYTIKPEKNKKREIILTNKNLAYESCAKYKGNKTYFLNNSFSNFQLDYYQCIKPGENLTLYGKFGDITNGYRSLGIILNKCNNETLKKNRKNFTCFCKEDIEKKLYGFKIVFLYVSYNMNHYAFDGSHLFFSETGDYFGLTTEHQKIILTSFSKNIYITDKSFIFNTKDRREFFTLSDKMIDYDPITLNYKNYSTVTNDTFGVILMSMDGRVIMYNRSFEKITDLFVQLGGIYNLIIVIFKLIIKWITSKMKIIDFVNSLPFKQYKIEKNKQHHIKFYENNNNKYHSNLQLFAEINRLKLSREDNNNLSFNNSSELIMKKKNALEDIKEVNDSSKYAYNNISIHNSNSKSNNIKNINFRYNNDSIKEDIKKLGNSVMWFYICPIFLIKKFKKFKFFYFLYQRLVDNLSIEKLFIIMSKWPIIETIINDDINANNYIIKEKTNSYKFNSNKLSKVNCINIITKNNK